jgi:hypothetical protein
VLANVAAAAMTADQIGSVAIPAYRVTTPIAATLAIAAAVMTALIHELATVAVSVPPVSAVVICART